MVTPWVRACSCDKLFRPCLRLIAAAVDGISAKITESVLLSKMLYSVFNQTNITQSPPSVCRIQTQNVSLSEKLNTRILFFKACVESILLYGLSTVLRRRRQQIAGHYKREIDEPVSKLVFRKPPRGTPISLGGVLTKH